MSEGGVAGAAPRWGGTGVKVGAYSACGGTRMAEEEGGVLQNKCGLLVLPFLFPMRPERREAHEPKNEKRATVRLQAFDDLFVAMFAEKPVKRTEMRPESGHALEYNACHASLTTGVLQVPCSRSAGAGSFLSFPSAAFQSFLSKLEIQNGLVPNSLAQPGRTAVFTKQSTRCA